MRDFIQVFPVKSVVLMKEAVGQDVCPECGGALDRGKVCMGCQTDWHKHMPARYQWKPPADDRR
jgi:hypothetical protein